MAHWCFVGIETDSTNQFLIEARNKRQMGGTQNQYVVSAPAATKISKLGLAMYGLLFTVVFAASPTLLLANLSSIRNYKDTGKWTKESHFKIIKECPPPKE